MSNVPPIHVLIVDNEPNVARLVAMTLEGSGDKYIVDIVDNVNETLAKLQKISYALLIVNDDMPGMISLKLTTMVRQVWPNTQLILMTSYGTNKLHQMIKHRKLDGYIDKPATTTQIREIIKQAVERSQVDIKSNTVLTQLPAVS